MAFPSFESDPSILLATMGRKEGDRTSVRSVIGTWDMINVDVPSRQMIETAAGALRRAGLVTIDDDWVLRLTAEGARIRRLPWGMGMREVPGALQERLPPLEPDPTVRLPQDIYDEALADYLAPRKPLWLLLWRRVWRGSGS